MRTKYETVLRRTRDTILSALPGADLLLVLWACSSLCAPCCNVALRLCTKCSVHFSPRFRSLHCLSVFEGKVFTRLLRRKLFDLFSIFVFGFVLSGTPFSHKYHVLPANNLTKCASHCTLPIQSKLARVSGREAQYERLRYCRRRSYHIQN